MGKRKKTAEEIEEAKKTAKGAKGAIKRATAAIKKRLNKKTKNIRSGAKKTRNIEDNPAMLAALAAHVADALNAILEKTASYQRAAVEACGHSNSTQLAATAGPRVVPVSSQICANVDGSGAAAAAESLREHSAAGASATAGV